MDVAQKPCSPSRITELTFLAYLGHQWTAIQLQNQRKRFLFNLFYAIPKFYCDYLPKCDPKILLYETLLHTPHMAKFFSEYPGLHIK